MRYLVQSSIPPKSLQLKPTYDGISKKRPNATLGRFNKEYSKLYRVNNYIFGCKYAQKWYFAVPFSTNGRFCSSIGVIMKIFSKISTSLIAFAALSASIAPAMAEAFYTSPVSAPMISMSNYIYESSNWTVGATGFPIAITQLSYDINYSNGGAVQIRICQRPTSSTIDCASWTTAHDSSTTYFNTKDASKPFFFQARVVTSPSNVGKVLNPKPSGSGNSMLTVGYQ